MPLHQGEAIVNEIFQQLLLFTIQTSDHSIKDTPNGEKQNET